MEINVNVQTSTENHQSTNANHNYDNRRSYNNLPLQTGECLVPIRVDWEMVKHFNMCQDNLETWHIGPNKVPLVLNLRICLHHQTIYIL